MKNSLLLVAAVAVVTGLSCQAQTAQDLGVAERSDFNAPLDGRDPFLPVGWQKPPQEPLSAESGTPAQPLLKPELFVVSSISVDRIRLAVINGKLCGEGDGFPFLLEGKQQVKVQVLKIQDGMVTLGCGSMQVTCPLRLSSGQKAVKKP
ncbi:MAG: hypothetical protein WCH57_02335 [Verrucomicrobiota bacterium]